MAEETRYLTVGDKIYEKGNYGITDVLTIGRLTKTQAISECGNYRFRLELDSYGSATKIGPTEIWSSRTYYLETPELKAKLIRQVNIKRLKNVDFNSLSDATLEQILIIINNG